MPGFEKVVAATQATPEPADAAPLADSAATPDTDEAQAEELVVTVLDLAAEADAAAHGDPADLLDEAALDADGPASSEAAAPAPATALEDASETKAAESPLEVDDEADDALADGAGPASTEAGAPKADTSATDLEDAVQEQLAQSIAAAAKATREAAPTDSTLDAAVGGLSVAELVQQKLSEAAAKAKSDQNADPVAQPHGEDLVADARSALEEALAD